MPSTSLPQLDDVIVAAAASEPNIRPVCVVDLPQFGTDAAWRTAARGLLLTGVLPEAVSWQIRPDATAQAPVAASRLRVPQDFLNLANTVLWHRRAERFDLLYRLLWRLRREPALIDRGTDAAVEELHGMAASVRTCLAASKRRLRLHAVGLRQFEGHLAPRQMTLEPMARFFAARYPDINWRILTPDGTAVYSGGKLSFTPEISEPAKTPPRHKASHDLLQPCADLFSRAGLSVGSCLIDPN